jgi:transposase
VKKYIGCDAHARYSVFVGVDEAGRVGPAVRVNHGSRELRDYLATLEPETPIAVEASGGWYWFMDELEAAGMDARLVNPLEAKRRMGGKNKTDKLDAKGLAILCRNGTLPEVWIPPAELRDLRGLMRGRLALRSHTTVLKNRIQAALRRYGTLAGEAPGDLFGKRTGCDSRWLLQARRPRPASPRCTNGNCWMLWSGISERWRHASARGSENWVGSGC